MEEVFMRGASRPSCQRLLLRIIAKSLDISENVGNLVERGPKPWDMAHEYRVPVNAVSQRNDVTLDRRTFDLLLVDATDHLHHHRASFQYLRRTWIMSEFYKKNINQAPTLGHS